VDLAVTLSVSFMVTPVGGAESLSLYHLFDHSLNQFVLNDSFKKETHLRLPKLLNQSRFGRPNPNPNLFLTSRQGQNTGVSNQIATSIMVP